MKHTREEEEVSLSLLAFLRAQSGVSMVASRKNERKVTSVLFHSSTRIGRFLCRFRWCDKYTQSFYVQIHDKRTSQNKSHAQKKASSLSALCSALTTLTTLIVGQYGTIYHEKDICNIFYNGMTRYLFILCSTYAFVMSVHILPLSIICFQICMIFVSRI